MRQNSLSIIGLLVYRRTCVTSVGGMLLLVMAMLGCQQQDMRIDSFEIRYPESHQVLFEAGTIDSSTRDRVARQVQKRTELFFKNDPIAHSAKEIFDKYPNAILMSYIEAVRTERYQLILESTPELFPTDEIRSILVLAWDNAGEGLVAGNMPLNVFDGSMPDKGNAVRRASSRPYRYPTHVIDAVAYGEYGTPLTALMLDRRTQLPAAFGHITYPGLDGGTQTVFLFQYWSKTEGKSSFQSLLVLPNAFDDPKYYFNDDRLDALSRGYMSQNALKKRNKIEAALWLAEQLVLEGELRSIQCVWEKFSSDNLNPDNLDTEGYIGPPFP